MKGKFIVFEGIDGSGKTSQIKILKDNLANLGIDSIITAEPSKGAIGQLLRSIQQGKEISNPNPYMMAFLYAADRSYHVDWIKTKLEEGSWILCDRYKFSSFAYQGNNNLDLLDLTKEINSIFPEPDHSFLLNITPDESLSRTADRSTVEIFEKRDFLEEVSNNYKKLFTEAENRNNTSIIDASLTQEEVSTKILSILRKKYIL